MSLRSQATCNEFFPNGACNVSSSGDPEWEIPRARLNVEKVIGRGAFGVVSRGLAFDLPGKPGWTVVAVKSVQGYISLYFPLKKDLLYTWKKDSNTRNTCTLKTIKL